MKRYKLLTQDGYDSFKAGEIYEEGDTFFFATIRDFVNEYPSDWEEVVEVVETEEEVVNKLVDEYWFDEDGAKRLIEEYTKITTMSIYEVAKLIGAFK